MKHSNWLEESLNPINVTSTLELYTLFDKSDKSDGFVKYLSKVIPDQNISVAKCAEELKLKLDGIFYYHTMIVLYDM